MAKINNPYADNNDRIQYYSLRMPTRGIDDRNISSGCHWKKLLEIHQLFAWWLFMRGGCIPAEKVLGQPVIEIRGNSDIA